MRLPNALIAFLAVASMGCRETPNGDQLGAVADSLRAGRSGSVCHVPATLFQHGEVRYTSCELVVGDTVIAAVNAPDGRIVFVAKTWSAGADRSQALRQLIDTQRRTNGDGRRICVTPDDSVSIEWQHPGYVVTAYPERTTNRIGLSFSTLQFKPKSECRH